MSDNQLSHSVLNTTLLWATHTEGTPEEKLSLWQEAMKNVAMSFYSTMKTGDFNFIPATMKSKSSRSAPKSKPKKDAQPISEDEDDDEVEQSDITEEQVNEAIEKIVEYLNEKYPDNTYEYLSDKNPNYLKIIRKFTDEEGEDKEEVYALIAITCHNRASKSVRNKNKTDDREEVTFQHQSKNGYDIKTYFNENNIAVRCVKTEKLIPGDILKVSKTGAIKIVPSRRGNVVSDYDDVEPQLDENSLKNKKAPPRRKKKTDESAVKRKREESNDEEDSQSSKSQKSCEDDSAQKEEEEPSDADTKNQEELQEVNE